MNFSKLKKEGKTVIYKESKSELHNTDFEYWGKRITETEEVSVYRKIASFEEAEQYELENELFN